ncbi:LysM peptidoglycan-binding domain-containing protein [Enterococcus caccae]|uniref:LysM domain-containing protein n=1 Tax=Enterococcus caccae ATCC BAA-1240 TaxID=1158612 RepID=R3X0X0_9ENTE|nr:LysM peptidoglycan-binding domain-containing protein [Enterococcus caccae]EOL47670.1 hypothetical protein UC7_00920 [Enterococcus caccae ATCC BAA-1240]EOT65468.1 hypothetical protein I580_01224 [Enterococcus caccae ATCC BAA-1240]OJG27353.1 hypothetical protein RU98_GL002805 [Enterococcus caccae]
MKNRINKKYLTLLIFSAILFSTAIYLSSSSFVLGASVGGETVSAIPIPIPAAPTAETQDAAAEKASTVSKENEQPKEVYLVKKGQTLWEIAQESGVSIQTLMNKNQLGSSVIVEGQELVMN